MPKKISPDKLANADNDWPKNKNLKVCENIMSLEDKLVKQLESKMQLLIQEKIKVLFTEFEFEIKFEITNFE